MKHPKKTKKPIHEKDLGKITGGTVISTNPIPLPDPSGKKGRPTIDRDPSHCGLPTKDPFGRLK